MLMETFILYRIIYQLVLLLGEPYRKKVVQDENTEWGVYRCKERLQSATPTCVGGDHNQCVSPEFNVEEDPIGILTQQSVVHLTIPEVNYLAKIEETKNWDLQEVANVIAYIKQSQLVRQILAQA